jgi:hypothetical protein
LYSFVENYEDSSELPYNCINSCHSNSTNYAFIRKNNGANSGFDCYCSNSNFTSANQTQCSLGCESNVNNSTCGGSDQKDFSVYDATQACLDRTLDTNCSRPYFNGSTIATGECISLNDCFVSCYNNPKLPNEIKDDFISSNTTGLPYNCINNCGNATYAAVRWNHAGGFNCGCTFTLPTPITSGNCKTQCGTNPAITCGHVPNKNTWSVYRNTPVCKAYFSPVPG